MRVTFQTSVNPIRQKPQRPVKADLGSIGVDVVLKVVDAGIFFGDNLPKRQ